MAKEMYAGDSFYLARKITGGYVGDTGNVARKITKAYMGDASGIARLIWQANSPLVVNYTGTYTDETVQMSDGTYRLLTLSGSGTLTFNQPTLCDIWACGGGGSGGKSGNSTVPYGGGGGGYVQNKAAVIVQSLIVAIGVGGVGGKGTSGYGAAGADTQITGDVTMTSTGGGTSGSRAGGDGGSGGGAGATGFGTSDYAAGEGSGISTRPFNDASQLPYCAGGGAAGSRGGHGGSNGSDGVNYDTDNTNLNMGGEFGGGQGTLAQNANGGDATGFGSGGGGSYSRDYKPGAGYQGCVMVRIKLNDEGTTDYPISFTIDGTTYTAQNGMTWAEWVASDYNTADFYISGTLVKLGDEFVFLDGEEARTSHTIVSGGAYNLST